MRRNKHGNRRTEYDGHIFDSLMEMRRYQELRLLQAAGHIQGLVLQPKFCLLSGYRRKSGDWVRPIHYIADFQYLDCELGEIVVEDVKGYETAVFKLKRKMFEQKFGYELRLVQA